MSGERFTLDTNILIHSIDRSAKTRQTIALRIIDLAIMGDCYLTLQAVSEFYAATTRKGYLTATQAAAQATDWLTMFPCLAASSAAVRDALATAAAGRASYWDALLVATAGEGGCTAILTEDMQDGTTVHGVRIISPFEEHDLSQAALRLLSPEVGTTD